MCNNSQQTTGQKYVADVPKATNFLTQEKLIEMNLIGVYIEKGDQYNG